MASTRRRIGEVGIFFIYDHNRLKKEEDDLKDAILYFYPNYIKDDEKCLICGQMMGMAEFFLSTISKSPPKIFKLQTEKYCFKRVGIYSFVLEGRLEDADKTLIKHLDYLYNSFVLYCGSIDYIRQQYGESHRGFLAELNAFWDMLLPLAGHHDNHLYQVFQVLPSVELPKSGSELFLQSSNILQSSQRRPGVLMGTLMYKNRVLCTQMSTELTRKLILITPQLPCHEEKTDYDLPIGVRLVSIFLTDEEHQGIKPLYKHYNKHCKSSRFMWNNSDSQGQGQRDFSATPKRFKQLENIPEKESSSFEDSSHLTKKNVAGMKIMVTGTATNQNQYTCISPKSNVGKYSFSENEISVGSPVPLITISGEEATISDYEDDGDEEKSVKKQQMNFGKNGYKSHTNKEIKLRNNSLAIEDLEHGTNSKDHKLSDAVDKIKIEDSDDVFAIEDFDTKPITMKNEVFGFEVVEKTDKNKISRSKDFQKNKDGLIVTVDVHADFEESSEYETANNTFTLVSGLGSDDEHSSKEKPISESDLLTAHLNKHESESSNLHVSENAMSDDVNQGNDNSVHRYISKNDSSSLGQVDLKDNFDTQDKKQTTDEVICENGKSDLNISLNEDRQEISADKNVPGLDDSTARSETCDQTSVNLSGKVNDIGKQISSVDDSGPIIENVDCTSSIDDSAQINDSVKQILSVDQSAQSPNENAQTEENESWKKEIIDQKLEPCSSVDDLSVTDHSESAFQSRRGETTTPDSNSSDVVSSEIKETLDFPVGDSHGVSADESASEMPNYRNASTNQINRSVSKPETTNQESLNKSQYSNQNSIDSVIQIGDSIDSYGSDRTMVSMGTQSSVTSEIEGLNEVTLYVQRHSDVSLLLLMDQEAIEKETVIISLWKAALPHLADMDFYVKECIELHENEHNRDHKNYIQYDTFFQNIKGNVQPVTGTDEEFHRLSGSMHETLMEHPNMTDILHRSHSSCCYGHRNINDETFYQLSNSPIIASSLPSSKHPIFAIDTLAARQLPEKHKVNLL